MSFRALSYLGIGALVLSLAGIIYLKGVTNTDKKHELEDARDAIETDERIDGADVSTGDPVDDREWLLTRPGPGGR